MEAFSLLKYWRGGGGATAGAAASAAAATTKLRNTLSTNTTPTTTTIATTVQRLAMETDDDDDEGPFFDLEFAVPDDEDDDNDEDEGEHNDQDSGEEEEEEEDEDEESAAGTDGEREFNFTVSSDTSVGGRTDPNLSLSPSDDLFFKGRLVPLEPSSLVFNPSEPNSKPQFPVSLLKSATKFRVFMLGLKKPKSAATEPNTNATAVNGAQKPQQQSKFFTVKFKVEEVPIVSLFTRDNSSRISGNGTQKQQSDDSASATSEDKRFSKDVVQKYLKMIKPLYVRVSKRYGEKLRFSGQLSAAGVGKMKSEGGEAPTEEAEAVNLKNQKQGNLPAGLRVVCKHLGKSRSASSAVAAVVPLSAQSQRRDDSLLQQQDGIQSAIAHCKRSFTASKETDPSLPRCKSDTCDEKSVDSAKPCSEKGKEFCL